MALGGSKDYIVLTGGKWRVQIVVYDFTGAPGNVKRKMIQSGESLTTFVVNILRSTENKSTPFNRGKQVYFGDSFKAALRTARRYLRGVNVEDQIPKRWRSYDGG